MAVCGFTKCKFYKSSWCSDPEPSTAEYCKGVPKIKPDYIKIKLEFTKAQVDYLLILLREEADSYQRPITTSDYVEEAQELLDYIEGIA